MVLSSCALKQELTSSASLELHPGTRKTEVSRAGPGEKEYPFSYEPSPHLQKLQGHRKQRMLWGTFFPQGSV